MFKSTNNNNNNNINNNNNNNNNNNFQSSKNQFATTASGRMFPLYPSETIKPIWVI